MDKCKICKKDVSKDYVILNLLIHKQTVWVTDSRIIILCSDCYEAIERDLKLLKLFD